LVSGELLDLGIESFGLLSAVVEIGGEDLKLRVQLQFLIVPSLLTGIQLFIAFLEVGSQLVSLGDSSLQTVQLH